MSRAPRRHAVSGVPELPLRWIQPEDSGFSYRVRKPLSFYGFRGFRIQLQLLPIWIQDSEDSGGFRGFRGFRRIQRRQDVTRLV